ncbi:TIM-barrel domain-containing protein [Brachybacterium sp. J153]|uniref:TIM-barrel domain-containing protein n=1 Tax=Brachybacterium sp. J153 TaxID=3116488 RepID=UPI002E781678|nr:TIM-barrel domain-containing protein [Brachybacterium sp. J153]MEE1619641.1 TIM-barrel domain-containing protein [Brachybacterium sp. J153]
MSDSLLSADGTIRGDTYRISPVAPRVVRLEWSPTGRFEDRPSTFAIRRDLPPQPVRATREHGRLVVVSDHYRLEYDEGPFSTNGLQVQVTGAVSAYHSVWRYGQDLSLPAHQEGRRRGESVRVLDGNLGGAARTLDEADGPIPLEPGVNSRHGYAVIDDSRSMVFDADGHLVPRDAEPEALDLYVFTAGHDHIGAVADLHALSGPQPLLPRFALGTWWSRFHRYDEDSYLALMDRFRDERIPLSVAVIDMDWHLTDVDPRYGSGWTGYTWNRELFPDPARFQRALHDRGLAVTLNVHPADGVRAFEEAYPAMCAALGREADGEPILFDASDPAFMDAYFEVLHRGLEELGTDFWWIDWQSGPYSRRAGLDPLWVLNHGHFEDNRRDGRRPLTFSRYAGPGSHRYPVGFSGDSVTTWETLAFQPRFTAAGANIGYGWWSHDIGGHMEGYRDDELAARWVQFGVFSPIMRLHSSNSPFAGKEPWRFGAAAEASMTAHLRMRHRLVPYLHAMNRRAHLEGRSLVEPSYFTDPSPEAYERLDQYSFGSELLVAPITCPSAPDTGRAGVDVRLPAGRWTDITTGLSYQGDRTVRMHRDLSSIPVLLRAGGFLPLAAETEDPWSDSTRPDLEILVAVGADGAFTLWEEPEEGIWTSLSMEVDVAAGVLRLRDGGGALGGRRLVLRVLGADADAFADLSGDAAGVSVRRDGAAALLDLGSPAAGAEIELRSAGFTTIGGPDRTAQIEDLLHAAQVGFALKERVLAAVQREGAGALAELSAIGSAPTGHAPITHDYDRPSPALIAAVAEILGAE